MSEVGPIIESHVVLDTHCPVRVDRFAADVFRCLPSRAAARKALKRRDLEVDGEHWVSGRYLSPGQTITLRQDSRPTAKPYPRDIVFPYLDEHVAVAIKPPGLPTSGNYWKTLENALAHNLALSTEHDALRVSRPVHRLDVRTGGLIVCARTGTAMTSLSESFQERRVSKRYRAIVVGRLEGEGECTEDVEGRAAHTLWRAVEHTPSLTTDWLTTVECRPVTGRTHQIRRHMQGLGHAILGDDLYGGRKVLRGKGLYLWSLSVRVPHPVTGDFIEVDIDEPAKFESCRRREAARVARRE